MKKLLALCLTAVLCLCCLASCGSAHEENEWFSEEKLTNCLVGDLPTIEKDYVNRGGEDIYVSFTDSEFKAYVKSVYDYLCSQEYNYLGTRGEQKNTLAGAFTTYYFEPATELESFRVLEGDYVFVFSDGSTDENGDVEFIILVIYDVSTNTLEYGNKKFTYNTQISLRRGSEAPLSGFYVLKEIAEGNHFIRNQAGAQWLGEITAEDIAEIKMISGGGGPLPPVSKTHISISQDKAVIESIFEEYYWLDSTPVSEERTQIADGGYFIVQFILNNGETKQLYFINGDFYHDDNDNYFELVRLPVFRDGTNFVTRYGFERQYDPYQIHLIDGTPVCEIPFSEFEFTELTDDIYLDAELPTHYFELHGERVYFIRGEYFYIGDNRSVYYQLIGNLDELIAKYSTTTDQDISNDIFYAAAYPENFEYNGRHYRIVQGEELKTTATQEELGGLLGYIIREEDVSAFIGEYPSIDYVIDNGIYDYETQNRVAFYSLKSYTDLSIICMHQGGGYVLYQCTTDLLS